MEELRDIAIGIYNSHKGKLRIGDRLRYYIPHGCTVKEVSTVFNDLSILMSDSEKRLMVVPDSFYGKNFNYVRTVVLEMVKQSSGNVKRSWIINDWIANMIRRVYRRNYMETDTFTVYPPIPLEYNELKDCLESIVAIMKKYNIHIMYKIDGTDDAYYISASITILR